MSTANEGERERSVPDFDIYRIEELPKDELGGASGEKRKFRLEFIGKAPNESFPYTVANEVVSSFIGTVLGLNIPTMIPYRIEDAPLALVLWMKPAAREQQGPPLTSRELKQFLAQHEDEIHGAIVLDVYLANTDRAFGPERRNIAVDDKGQLLLFDFGNALFYRQRPHAGIQAGVPRLQAVEQDLRNMFDKQEKNPQSYYFQLLSNWSLVEKWCDRIRKLPDYVLEGAVSRVPEEIEPPSQAERQSLMEFLMKRREYLLEHIRRNVALFPGLAGGSTT